MTKSEGLTMTDQEVFSGEKLMEEDKRNVSSNYFNTIGFYYEETKSSEQIALNSFKPH